MRTRLLSFAVAEEIVVISLPCPSMSGCKNVTRAPNRSLAPVSGTGFTTGAAVRIAMGGHRVKIAVISDCLEITYNFQPVFLLKRYVNIKFCNLGKSLLTRAY